MSVINCATCKHREAREQALSLDWVTGCHTCAVLVELHEKCGIVFIEPFPEERTIH